MLERIDATHKGNRRCIKDGLFWFYSFSMGDEAVQHLREGQGVLLYEQSAIEIELEVEAQAHQDSVGEVWKFYPYHETTRYAPYRRPARGAFAILYQGEPIGEMRTPRYSQLMVVTGPFTPYPAYEPLRPFFQRYFATPPTAALFKERDALGLAVETQNGRRIDTPWIEVADGSADMIAADIPRDAHMCEATFPTREGFYSDAIYWVEDEPMTSDAVVITEGHK